MKRIFNFAAIAGIISVSLLFLMGILVLLFTVLLGVKPSENWMIIPQVAAFLAVLIWLACTSLLWIEGWIFIAEKWKNRSGLVNALLILAQVFWSVFAAYILHFVRTGRLGGGQKHQSMGGSS
ncbi:MAG TPA: hypothetical protein VN836_07980 [Verrucomicrobiae bacterium]|nr:hypothetical protein [Verrucomicrobiae bacterium]